MEREEMKGKIDRAKGYVKDKAGEISDNPELEAEGEAERAGGKLREDYGAAKRKVKDAADKVTGQDE